MIFYQMIVDGFRFIGFLSARTKKDLEKKSIGYETHGKIIRVRQSRKQYSFRFGEGEGYSPPFLPPSSLLDKMENIVNKTEDIEIIPISKQEIFNPKNTTKGIEKVK